MPKLSVLPKLGLSVVILIIVSGFSGLPIIGEKNDPVVIEINPQIQYQMISGWEATAQAGQAECEGFDIYKDELFDLAVNDLGINRLRVQIKSGAENNRDYWSDFQQGVFERRFWRGIRYSTNNDNDDPFILNWDGFHFTELDNTIENVVLPIKKRLEENGESLHINLIYIAFTKQIAPGLKYHHQDPQEYAEFILAATLHMNERFGLVPDTWEVILEPDNVPEWDGRSIGEAVIATAKRLEENGFEPEFIAPSNANMETAIEYFDEMIFVPGVKEYLQEFSYHRYGGATDRALDAIVQRASQFNINTAMLEHIGGDHIELHMDLKDGFNTSWHQFTLGYCSTEDDGGAYYLIDNQDPNSPSIEIAQRTRYLRQYFKFIRSGAQRIGGQSSDSSFDPLVFVNTDGSYVVVIKTNREGDIKLVGLPEGNYSGNYTTEFEYDTDIPDVYLETNQPMLVNIPDAGVLTVYSKAEPQVKQTHAAVAAKEMSDRTLDSTVYSRRGEVTEIQPAEKPIQTQDIGREKFPFTQQVSTPQPQTAGYGINFPLTGIVLFLSILGISGVFILKRRRG